MALDAWVYPTINRITGSTKVIETDNRIQAALDDMVHWLNSTDTYSETGLTNDLISKIQDHQDAFDAKLIDWQSEVDNIPSEKIDAIALDMGVLLSTRNITSITYDTDDRPTLITYSGGWYVEVTYIASGYGEGETDTITYKRGTDTIYTVAYTYGSNDKIQTQTFDYGTWTDAELYDLMMVAI